jgi:hypothetical protein
LHDRIFAFVEFVDGVVPDDASLEEHGDVRSKEGEAYDVVCNGEYGGLVFFCEGVDEVVDGIAHDGVESCCGFVTEEDIGVGCEGACKADSFFHASGEGDGEEIGTRGVESDIFEEAYGFLFCVVLGEFVVHDEGEGDIVPDGEAIEEGGVLEEDAAACVEFAAIFLASGFEFLSVEGEGAFVCGHESEYEFEEYGFSGAGSPEYGEGLLGEEFEVYALEDVMVFEGFV